MRCLAPLALALPLGLAGCEALLSFDEVGRPCSPEDACLPGYTCLVRKCYANGSVQEGDTCSASSLCAEGLVCAVPDFVCRQECDNGFFADSGCPANRVCLERANAEGQSIAACTVASCVVGGTPCPSAGPSAVQTCVGVSEAGDGACYESCAVTCSGGTCRDDCTLISEGPQLACQPLGKLRTMACIEESPDQLHGHTCDLGKDRCADGYACVRPPTGRLGMCLKYCDPAAGGTPCAGLCSPRFGTSPAACMPLDGTSYSVCGELPADAFPAGDGAQFRTCL